MGENILGPQDIDDMTRIHGPHNHTHNLKPRKPRTYEHMFTTLVDIVLTQYPVKKGLKILGSEGKKAVRKEMLQIHLRDVIEPKDPQQLSTEEKRKALKYLMYLKRREMIQSKQGDVLTVDQNKIISPKKTHHRPQSRQSLY